MSIANEAQSKDFEPKVLAITCNWCTYAGADLAGISRMSYPANIRVIRVPCSSRVNPMYVLRAFQKGADSVLVSGCHPGDCHYGTGNYYTRRRYLIFKRLLEYIGFEPGRFNASWISGAEGAKFAATMNKITEATKSLGPNKKMRDDIV